MSKTYEDGYRDGLEAAAKVCERHSDVYQEHGMLDSKRASDYAAGIIRNLPVPESKQAFGGVLPYDVKIGSTFFGEGVGIPTLIKAATRWHEQAAEAFAKEQKQPSVEDVARAIAFTEVSPHDVIHQALATSPLLQARGYSDAKVEANTILRNAAKAAMRACGVKVEG